MPAVHIGDGGAVASGGSLPRASRATATATGTNPPPRGRLLADARLDRSATRTRGRRRDPGRALARCAATLAALLAALTLLGCAIGSEPNPRPSAPVDAGRFDSGPSAPDTGPPPGFDAGPPEPDAGRPDAGPPPEPDAGCLAEACDGDDDDCDGVIDEDAACPCDVAHYGGTAYMICADPQSWLGARSRCEMRGYSLVKVDDSAEDAFVFGEIDPRGFDDTWVGLNDLFEEGTWVWSDDAPIVYSHWDEGEPNDGAGGEDCGVIMTVDGRQSEWDDRACDGERPYVCEAPAP